MNKDLAKTQSLLVSAKGAKSACPIYLIDEATKLEDVQGLDAHARAWLAANRFEGQRKRVVAVPNAEGDIAGVVLGIGSGDCGEPCGPAQLLCGVLAQTLRSGIFALAPGTRNAGLAAMAWGLGGYKFDQFKSEKNSGQTHLLLPEGDDGANAKRVVDGVSFGRDLINTPASDMGPDELEAAARGLADQFGADIDVTTGEHLLRENFPMIHAVGRASSRAPRLIDLKWAPKKQNKAPLLTLVGKGVCFDTGGLDLKPAANMLLMKKDMGGAATALALGHMIMAAGLNVRLRILVPAVENSVSGDAFRPSDILQSRLGLSVEVGNTDAEGRLVLADALALADEEKPDALLCFATLTGAARVALGADLPALFCDDDVLAQSVHEAGLKIGDPVWRLPLWPGYRPLLDSEIADTGNISNGPFGGAITAALFLGKFVKHAKRFAHVDLYGWRPAKSALGPKGGEVQSARAWFNVLRNEFGTATKGAST